MPDKHIVIQPTRYPPPLARTLTVRHHMRHTCHWIPRLIQHPVQRLQRKLPHLRQLQHPPRLQVRRDAHPVPPHIHRLVHVRRSPPQPRRIQLPFAGRQQLPRPLQRHSIRTRHALQRRPYMQHILRRIMVHIPNLADIVVGPRDRKFLLRQHLRRLIPRPRKVVAIILKRVVRVLRCVKPTQLPVAQPRVHPPDNLLRHPGHLRLDKRLERMHIVLQQLAVVVRHLFEMRHHPVLVHAIPMETPR